MKKADKREKSGFMQKPGNGEGNEIMQKAGNRGRNQFMQKEDRYDDIIRLPHPVSAKHPRMTMLERAAQFSPFAALTDYGAVIEETGRLTERRMEMDEDSKARVDEKLRYVQGQIHMHPEILVTYFVPDERKEGGSYVEARGRVKKMDPYERRLVLEDGRVIPLDEIIEVEV